MKGEQILPKATVARGKLAWEGCVCEEMSLVSLTGSCGASALCANHFLQVLLSPFHQTLFTPGKLRTSSLEAFLMDREQKENLTMVCVQR